MFGENEKRESGAALAWDHVVRPLHPFMAGVMSDLRRVSVYAAVRDTWKRSSPLWDEACEVSEALRFVPLDDLLAMGPSPFWEMARQLGPLLLKKKREAAAAAAKNAVRLTVDGRLVAVIPGLSLTSDVADICDADIIAGFDYVQEAGVPRLVWSLRSRGGVDVQAIAKRNGGGGHKAAAGFSVPDDGRSPYARVAELLGGAS